MNKHGQNSLFNSNQISTQNVLQECVLTDLQSKCVHINHMHFVTISTPDCLFTNNRHAANRMLWSTQAQTVVVADLPSTT